MSSSHGTGPTAAGAPGGAAAPGGLSRLAAVGPYFAVAQGAPGAGPPTGYGPLRELYAQGPGTPLAERIAVVARRLGTAEPRVAASILQLGLAARIWSVGLGAAVLTGEVPDLHPDRVHARLPEQGPIDLWLPQPAAGTTDPEQPVAALHRAVVVENLVPLTQAVRAVVPVSERLLRGNASSALAGALRVLHGHALAAGPDGDPDAGRRAGRLVEGLLALAPLTGTGALSLAGPQATPAFRRTSCCLYYRIGPGAGVCGDCVFDTPPR
ncbi:(2Fe-2S)-binding protein [Kitasatospora sp. NPDC050543]|uniref:(2Fe-2S)-binding protein n=1 Tax=Kitasatospora sp. NPDC050543 TaxID=3364054 RepID=UPI0037B94BE2